jgi:hypothetical protein
MQDSFDKQKVKKIQAILFFVGFSIGFLFFGLYLGRSL